MSNNETLKNLIKKNIAKGSVDAPISNANVKANVNVTLSETKIGESGQKEKVETEIKSEQKIVNQKVFKEKLGYISYEAGGNLSLGNFNMGKFSVSMMIPVGIELSDEYKKRLQDAFDFAKEWVDTRAAHEAQELMKLRS